MPKITDKTNYFSKLTRKTATEGKLPNILQWLFFFPDFVSYTNNTYPINQKENAWSRS